MDQINSLKTEQRFKKTEIGDIPVDWEVINIKEVCQNPEYGFTTSAKEEPIGPKLLRITDIQNGDVNWRNVPYCNCPNSLKKRFILKEGDILFARTGATTGKSYIIRECPEAIFASYLIRLRTKEIIESIFLYYLFNSSIYWKQIKQQIGGSAQGGVNATLLSNIKIPLPPLSEQKKIAEVLSTVDEAIEKKKSIIEKTKELKKGLMRELLTRGIGRTKFKKTELGEIPEDWNVVRIKDICEIIGGSTPSTNIKEYWNGDILWAVPTDITKLKDNVILDTEKNISKKGLSNSAAKLLPVGSILLTSRATIGELAINLKPMATNQGFANFICRTEIYNWYLFYRLILIKKELKRLASGSTFKEISKNSIRAIKIPLPPLEEQMTIGDILLSLDEVIKQETKNTEYFKNVKKGIMAVLLTGKIRVKYY